jgi:hypothetical protein
MKGELTRRYGVVLIDSNPNLEPRLRMGEVMHVLLPVPSWHVTGKLSILPLLNFTVSPCIPIH